MNLEYKYILEFWILNNKKEKNIYSQYADHGNIEMQSGRIQFLFENPRLPFTRPSIV